MIAEPLTRRSVVIGGLLGTATLSGCSVAQLTTRKVVDPEAADRGRIARALQLSWLLQRAIEGTPATRGGGFATVLTAFTSLHEAQTTEFARAGDLPSPEREQLLGMTPALTPVSLRDREGALARSLRTLGLHASSGEVAALLASAAAGIDQALAR